MKYVVMEMAVFPMEDDRAARFKALGYPVCDSPEDADKEVRAYCNRVAQPFRLLASAMGLAPTTQTPPEAPVLTDETEEQSTDSLDPHRSLT